MTPIMTPSTKTTTAGQIDKAVANYRALLEKHSREFGQEAVQTVLGQSELADEQLAVFRRRVEMVSNLVTRRVKVNRTRTQQEALDATGRVRYTDSEVVETMPKGEGDEADVIFFKPRPHEYTRPGFINDADLEKAYEWRGLKPADPYSVAAVNESDTAFADEHPHGTYWKDSNGKWCFATFSYWEGKRRVGVCRDGGGWRGGWWFAGVRK